MLNFALDPLTGELVSPEKHHDRKLIHGKNAVCPSCQKAVYDHSVGNLRRKSHFNHAQNSGHCPTKRGRLEPPFHTLLDYDGNGIRRREAFFSNDKNIQFAFSVCETLVCGRLPNIGSYRNNFTLDRFIELLIAADQKKVWRLKALTPRLLPFELVAYEIFNVKDSVSIKPQTFVLSRYRPYTDAIPSAPPAPAYLVKYFYDARTGRTGSLVKSTPGNPFSVTEECAEELASRAWRTQLSHHDKRIVMGNFL